MSDPSEVPLLKFNTSGVKMNLDFSTNKYASIGELYLVTLCVDGRLYEYSVFSFDHWQALLLAIADHNNTG
jgi:hypothetical protein